MFRFMLLFLLLVPPIEIYFLIQIGSVVGTGWTIFMVIATALLGVALLRIQGISTLKRAQVVLAGGQLPALAMMEGVVLLLSGALLLTPGFFTDTIGFMLLVPACRQILIKRLARHGYLSFYDDTVTESPTSHSHAHPIIIEGKFSRDDDDRYLN